MYLSRDLYSPTFSSSFSVVQRVKCTPCKSKLFNHHILGEIVKVVLPEAHIVIDSHILDKNSGFIAFNFTRPLREMSNAVCHSSLSLGNIDQSLHLLVPSWESF